jgi:anti-sigma-K factor RskA
VAESRPGGLTCTEATELVPGFVLGALEPDEAAAVRAHLATCSAVHQEVDDLGSTASVLLESVPLVEPPPALRARLLGAAAAGQTPASVVSPTPVQTRQFRGGSRGATEGARERSGRRPWVDRLHLARPSAVLGLAAAIAIAVLGTWSLTLQQRLSDADRFNGAVAAALDLASRPGSTSAVLAPETAGGPAGFAAVGADGSVTVAVRGLPPTTGRAVYEAWAIPRDGTPVPIGGFTVGSDGTGTVAGQGRPAAEVTAVALTLEAGPGATTPTLPIVVSGSAAPRPA